MAREGYGLVTLLILNCFLPPVRGGLLLANNPINQLVQILFEPSGLIRIAEAADVFRNIVLNWATIVPKLLMLPYLASTGKLRKKRVPLLKNPETMARLEKLVDFLNKAFDVFGGELLGIFDDEEKPPSLGGAAPQEF